MQTVKCVSVSPLLWVNSVWMYESENRGGSFFASPATGGRCKREFVALPGPDNEAIWTIDNHWLRNVRYLEVSFFVCLPWNPVRHNWILDLIPGRFFRANNVGCSSPKWRLIEKREFETKKEDYTVSLYLWGREVDWKRLLLPLEPIFALSWIPL